MRQRQLFLFFVVVAAFLTAAQSLSAQAWAGRGRLQGEIRDEQGKPIEGAKITFRKGTDRVDPKADGPKPVVTNKNGKWSILGLAGGPWGMLIEKEGYAPSEGQVPVNEFAVAQPLIVTLKSMAAMQAQVQAQAKAEGKLEPSGNAKAKAAIEQGNALLAQGKHAEARAQYEQALGTLEVDDPLLKASLQRTIARTWFEEGKQDQAIDTLKKALEIKPDDVETLQLISTLLVAAGREKEAETYMARLPEGTKVDPNSLLNLGIKLYNEKNYDGALQKFDQVVRDNPELATAYYYRGLTYLGLNKSAEAKADFQKLLQMEPNHPNAAEVREYISAL
jgi:tetratricopeptide (TPR) repeat protein